MSLKEDQRPGWGLCTAGGIESGRVGRIQQAGATGEGRKLMGHIGRARKGERWT